MHYRIVFGRLTAVGTLALALLSGCATTPELACGDANWHAAGFADGAQGQDLEQLNTRRKSCGVFSPDVSAYKEGRQEGLAEYCTLSNGVRAGKEGEPYSGVCPSSLEYYFLTGYRLGREIFVLSDNMEENQEKIASLEASIADVTDDHNQLAEMRFELRTLKRDVGRMQSRMQYLEDEERRIVIHNASLARSY